MNNKIKNSVQKEKLNFIYSNIVSLIEKEKNILQKKINNSMLSLYWEIGKILKVDVLQNTKPEYGKNIIINISDKLTDEYGNGFSRSSIFRMIQFYETFCDKEIVETLAEQLSWSHFIELISISKDSERNFYATLCYNENWSVKVLRERKKSMLFERTAISKKPEELIKRELEELRRKKTMSIDIFYRDPYVLDFLNLKDTYSEKDLENAILAQLEKFILEMGTDFAFLARQKRFAFAGNEYSIDLLFYHRKLRRLVAIDLKLGKFEPEHKGQIEMYLRWLKKYEKAKGEEDPIALILCADKSDEMVELLELNEGNIRVGQYLTQMPKKELLEKKLLDAIEMAKKQIEYDKK